MTPILNRYDARVFELEALARNTQLPIPVRRIRWGKEDTYVAEITALRVEGDKLLAEFSRPSCKNHEMSCLIQGEPPKILSVALLALKPRQAAHETLG